MIMVALALFAAETLNPRALEVLQSDPALAAWSLSRFDDNGDGWLSLFEAQPALEALKDLADSDRDGRVTVREFDNAVAFVRSRYGVQADFR